MHLSHCYRHLNLSSFVYFSGLLAAVRGTLCRSTTDALSFDCTLLKSSQCKHTQDPLQNRKVCTGALAVIAHAQPCKALGSVSFSKVRRLHAIAERRGSLLRCQGTGLVLPWKCSSFLVQSSLASFSHGSCCCIQPWALVLAGFVAFALVLLADCRLGCRGWYGVKKTESEAEWWYCRGRIRTLQLLCLASALCSAALTSRPASENFRPFQSSFWAVGRLCIIVACETPFLYQAPTTVLSTWQILQPMP